jgi:hypothetical protein
MALWQRRHRQLTDWIDITSRFAVLPESGVMRVAREGRTVTLMADGLVFADDAPFLNLGVILDEQFRPHYSNTDIGLGRRLAADPGGSIRIDRTGAVYLYQVKAGLAIRGTGTYRCDNPIPEA